MGDRQKKGAELRVGLLTDPDEISAVEALYRAVFTVAPTDATINPRLLIAIARNSGLVVGARSGATLVGFAFSFLARDDRSGTLYQYSQTAAVDPRWRGRGIGRALKFAQREAALARGVEHMRWLYDPMQTRNAHFNIDVLGGDVATLERGAYGRHGPPADGGVPADRLLVDWRLTSDHVRERVAAGPAPRPLPPIGPLAPGELREAEGEVVLALPASWNAVRALPGSLDLRTRIVDQIEALFADDYVATSCIRVDQDTAAYRFSKRHQHTERST